MQKFMTPGLKNGMLRDQERTCGEGIVLLGVKIHGTHTTIIALGNASL